MIVFARLARKYGLWLAVDSLVVAVSLLLAWSARSITASLNLPRASVFGLVSIVVYWACNYLFGLYHCLWCYASTREWVVIAKAVAVSTVLLALADLLWPEPRAVPLSVVLLMGLFAFVGFVSVRYGGRGWKGFEWPWLAAREPAARPHTRVLIVGAGDAGQLLAWRILNQKEGEDYELIGFVDDDPAKIGMRVHGRPVLGDRHTIETLVARYQVDLIIIAIYNISQQAFRQILAICERTSARIKVLPDIFEFINSTKGLPPICDVTAEDLLGRKPIEIDQQACCGLLAGKTVLITGAAGSIGSELSRQIARFGPERLLLLDNNESGLHDLAFSPEFRSSATPNQVIVGDVTHRRKMQSLFDQYRPQLVFHAAAYKHVPLMEEHPDEAVRVNVLGTWTVLNLACRYGAERFVLISTDKAVSPTSIMGATKRIGELMISSLDPEAPTLCTGVRFGNVLGSRGSVVPMFEREIAMGGPLTITHLEMTRYFMSISEAVSLVIQAATLTQGGDLFVLDMGKQIRIEELALRLVRLRGLRPWVDIPIKYIGIRPGEKLHEELTDRGEEKQPTSHPAIFRVQGACRIDRATLRREIAELVRLARWQRNGEIRARMHEIVGLASPATAPSGPAVRPNLLGTGEPAPVMPGVP